MATPLTSKFWKLFAALLLASSTVTFVLRAVSDALALRTLRRGAKRRPACVRAAEVLPCRPDRIPARP